MADILIRGMEMPKDGRITLQIGADGAVYLVEKCAIMAEKYEKSSHAIPLPEGHGRLVDADALMKKGIELDWSVQKWVQEVDIMTATTVVPAEGGGE